MSTCPCGSEKSYSECCETYHKNKALPQTALALMRSRYSAYVKGEIDYIRDTNNPNERANFDEEATRSWAKDSEWLGLEIVSVSDDEVEFKASFKRDGKLHVHHERSWFQQMGSLGRWYYMDGKEILTPIKAAPTPERNDPCPCGSGKKYKKCCAS